MSGEVSAASANRRSGGNGGGNGGGKGDGGDDGGDGGDGGGDIGIRASTLQAGLQSSRTSVPCAKHTYV